MELLPSILIERLIKSMWEVQIVENNGRKTRKRFRSPTAIDGRKK